MRPVRARRCHAVAITACRAGQPVFVRPILNRICWVRRATREAELRSRKGVGRGVAWLSGAAL
jgi:hypothetical protein